MSSSFISYKQGEQMISVFFVITSHIFEILWLLCRLGLPFLATCLICHVFCALVHLFLQGWCRGLRLDLFSTSCSCSRSLLHFLGFSSPAWHCWALLILCPPAIPQSLHPHWLFLRWIQEPAACSQRFRILLSCYLFAKSCRARN